MWVTDGRGAPLIRFSLRCALAGSYSYMNWFVKPIKRSSKNTEYIRLTYRQTASCVPNRGRLVKLLFALWFSCSRRETWNCVQWHRWCTEALLSPYREVRKKLVFLCLHHWQYMKSLMPSRNLSLESIIITWWCLMKLIYQLFCAHRIDESVLF